MKDILKIELKRAFKSKGMLLAVLIGCILALAQVIEDQIPAYFRNETMDFASIPIVPPSDVSGIWMAGNSTNLEVFIFFLLVPVFAMLPFGTSYFTDADSGFLKNIYARCGRKEFLHAKYLSAFISGGTAVVIPLLLNVLCCMALLPNLRPSTIYRLSLITPAHLFSSIFFKYPLLYILIFLLIDFVIGGIFACLTLAVSFLSDYKIVIAVIPFFIQLIIHVGCSLLGVWDYSIVYMGRAGCGIINPWVFLIYLAVGLLASWFIFTRKGEREDVF